MPTYGYRCETNGHEFEVVQPTHDKPIKKCQVCGAPVRRIFYPVGIVFKGQGFYKTDNRGSSSIAAAKTDSNAESKSDSKTSDSGSSDSKPAAKSDSSSKPAKESKSSSKPAAKSESS